MCFSLSLHFFHGNDADAGDVGAQLLRQRGGYGGYQLRCYLTGGLGRSRDRCRGGLFLYLKDYVKIFAAIIQKADDFEQIRFLSGELADTIGETFRTHIPYMKRLGITEEEIHSTRPHMDNNAYTHYMLWEAQTGDVLTGLVTLLNCSWSYAYVAEKIVERCPDALRDKRYGSWFAGYVSESYRRTNQMLIDRIDALSGFIDEKTAEHLCEIFEKCCLFDLRFWDMVYAMGGN